MTTTTHEQDGRLSAGGALAASRERTLRGDAHAASATDLTKRFDDRLALDRVSFTVQRGRVVGLLGRNGSGKTTLLRSLQGLTLPTSGRSTLLGEESATLSDATLARLGVVHQESRFLPWMTARTHLDFVRSFHEEWDRTRERRLIDDFELDQRQRIGSMSPGSIQKLAIITAVCHRPEVLLLDEPAASLDPPSREALYATLFDLLSEDSPAIIISSHQLDDIERRVDWILCLDQGRVVCDEALDVLQERFAQWRVLPAPGDPRPFPSDFTEPWIRQATVDQRGALLIVEDADDRRTAFEARHGVVVDAQPIGLGQMFRIWLQPPRRTGGAR
ncbi:MAG TPA: ABC transporter ATP-binding protein [Phycisphaerales bacterium]|nr:ABC transporter ATP-binding protein [Phycisphaerales bacterium]HMP36034.1 ABC transporter ATP-binding protein [Phycisphaerales bacterium]